MALFPAHGQAINSAKLFFQMKLNMYTILMKLYQHKIQ